MSETLPLASYLFTRLRQLGSNSVHGVPGDFNLELLDYLKPADLLWVGNTNELNAGYAADGYARIKGIGSLITTFGVGELSAINAIAGAYAERAGVVHIVGTPDRDLQEGRARVHHTFNDGNFDRFAEMHKHVTVAQTNLKDTITAPGEIDRVLQQCLIHSRPVYIAVPVDMVAAPVLAANLKDPITIPDAPATQRMSDAVDEILKKIYDAKKPAILFDGECRALKIVKDAEEIITSTKWPTWTTSYGRGLIKEDIPNFYGVFKGAFDDQVAQDYFKQTDLVLVFGPHFSTTNSYALSAVPKKDSSIIFTDTEVHIDSKILRDLPVRQVMKLLREKLETAKLSQTDISELDRLTWHTKPDISFATKEESGIITHDKLWKLVQGHVRPGDIILGETGTSGYGVREMKTPNNVRTFAPVTWLSIGYMLPATQGAALAHRELSSKNNNESSHINGGRSILFIGDGSLQMTVQEISTIIKLNLDVIIFVLNNNGYTIERVIHGLQEGYNDVASWRYMGAPNFFGGLEGTYTASAKNWGELTTILKDERLVNGKGLRMVELIMDREDVPGGPLAMLLEKERKRMENLKA